MFSIKTHTGFLAVCLFAAVAAGAGDYDQNDFATEIIEYIQGTGVPTDWLSGGQPFNNPGTALGRPTLATTGDGYNIPPGQSVPVVPVYAPFRSFEVVSVGNGGSLTVKFNHPVANDRNNPYGIDFIIFGNTAQTIAGGQNWTNGNPEETIVNGSTVVAEPGKVAVSQNGIDWYYFSNGPYADSFAPTASYAWDEVNDVWADELDPLKPIDPNLTAANLNGMTVAQVIETYNGSAGGTGFDIGLLGLDWIQYVRIENDPASDVTPEIDALADVSCCGDYKHPFPSGDFNGNCRVDFFDFAILARGWLTGNDWNDMSDLANNWLACTWKCL